MNRTLIDNYNKLVSYEDTVYFLGDFGFHTAEHNLAPIYDSLKGLKYLIKGNHDSRYVRKLFPEKLTFRELEMLYVSKHGKVNLRFSHYPHRDKNFDGLLLHGHTHSKVKFDGKRIHVGVDAWDFYPINLDKLLEAYYEQTNV